MTATFDLDADQVMIRDQAHEVLAEYSTLSRLCALLENKEGFDTALWNGTAELGWPGAVVAEAFGGHDIGWTTVCMLAEEIGRVCGAIPHSSTAVVADYLGTLASGHPDREYLADIAAGKVIATIGICEKGTNLLPAQPSVRFDGTRLYGTKAAVAFGAVASHALIYVRSSPGSVGLVLADLNDPSVMRQPHPALDDSRGYADLIFDGTPARLCENGRQNSAGWLLDRAAIAYACEQLGGAQACLDIACDYARTRTAFGQSIGRFQAIKHALADVYAAIEIARGNVYHALSPDGLANLPVAAATARLASTHAYELAAKTAIQVHGGIGVTWEGGLHHHYRRSRVLALELGSPIGWRNQLIDHLAGAAA